MGLLDTGSHRPGRPNGEQAEAMRRKSSMSYAIDLSASSASRLTSTRPTTLRFQNIRWTVKTSSGDKELLHGITGEVKPGEVLAIMGPSGAGKTSLIQMLCGRERHDELPDSGITLNGHPLDKRQRRRISYVMQNDVLLSNLTVYETLKYAALLRLPGHYTHQEKMQCVEDVIDALGLRHATETIIGNNVRRGVSGGEKKRVNIGVELMADPAVMILDEPTSGLDSSTALHLIGLLRKLATNQQRTIVASLHQPSSQLFAHMDKLLLLAKGDVAYFGPANAATAYFRQANMPCPPEFNPSDYFLDVLTDPERRQRAVDFYNSKQFVPPKAGKEISGPRILDLDASLSESSLDSAPAPVTNASLPLPLNGGDGDDDELAGDRWPIGWWAQTKILMSRSFKQSKGEFWTWINFCQGVVISVVVAALWWQTPERESRLQDRVGYSFFGLVYWSFQMLFLATQVFPSERDVLTKERASGSYRLSAYVVAKSISELPLLVALPTFFFVVTYWSVGLEGGYRALFAWMILLLCSFTTSSIGLFLGASVLNGKRAATAATVFMLTSMLLGGFYVQYPPPGLEWAKYLSLIKYGYHSLLALELDQSDLFFTCDVESSAYDACNDPLTRAQGIPARDVLAQYDVDDRVWLNVIALILFALFFRIAAYLSLKYLLFRHSS